MTVINTLQYICDVALIIAGISPVYSDEPRPVVSILRRRRRPSITIRGHGTDNHWHRRNIPSLFIIYELINARIIPGSITLVIGLFRFCAALMNDRWVGSFESNCKFSLLNTIKHSHNKGDRSQSKGGEGGVCTKTGINMIMIHMELFGCSAPAASKRGKPPSLSDKQCKCIWCCSKASWPLRSLISRVGRGEGVHIFIATMISAHKCVLSRRNDMTCYVMYLNCK